MPILDRAQSSLFEQVTELSRSYFRPRKAVPGKMVKAHLSTLNRAHRKAENFLRKKAATSNWLPEEINEWIAAVPSRVNAQPSPFQDLVHGLTTPEFNPYHKTRALAAQIDNLD